MSFDISKFIASLEKDYQPRAHAAVKHALHQFAEKVIADAQLICPTSPTMQYIEGKRGEMIKNPGWTGHSGFLSDSGGVGEITGSGNEMAITIGFNTDYAAYVHEILTNIHPNGEAKFLTKAMRVNAPNLLTFMEAELKKEFG